MSFYGTITAYDVHTYWNEADAEEKKAAWELRERVLKDFAKEVEAGDIRVHKFWDRPVGPHPVHMWELDFKSPDIFKLVVPYFQTNHGKLSVLIHPHSADGDYVDHTTGALWLGHKLKLSLNKFK